MKKTYILAIAFILATAVYSQVGINTDTPTETLDVNGRVRIRELADLDSDKLLPVYMDENGLLGRSTTNPSSPQTTFISSRSTTNVSDNFNSGNIIQLPITETNIGLNTLNTILENNSIKINSAGTYQLTAALNILLSTGSIDSRVYLAFNIQRSADNGESWRSVSGARPIFIMAATGTFFYNSVLPVVLVDLNENDLLRLVIYRTRANNGALQGSELTTAIVSQSNQHGTRAYSLSISKF